MKNRRDPAKRATYLFLYVISVLGSFALLASFVSTFFIVSPMPFPLFDKVLLGLLGLVALAFAVFFGRKAWHQLWRENLLSMASVALALFATGVIVETTLRDSVPPWPARILHAAFPEQGRHTWGRIVSLYPEAIGFNSWGQRDLEREIHPAQGRRRIGFLGDSYLEESVLKPISVIVQELVADNVEVLNLGVSATNLPEYYTRLAALSEPLHLHEVFLFFYMGNDLANYDNSYEWHAMKRLGIDGFLGSPPAPGLLAKLMPNLQFFFTRNTYAPYSVWVRGQIHQSSIQKLEELKEKGLESFKDSLYKKLNISLPVSALSERSVSRLYSRLTHPDMGLYREHYPGGLLRLQNEMFAQKNLDKGKEATFSSTLQWMELMAKYCQEHEIQLRVFLIPIAVAADSSIQELYRGILDIDKIVAHLRNIEVDLLGRLKQRNIDVIDLHPTLERPNTYLFPDGHWSDIGNQLVAARVFQVVTEEDGF